MGFVTVRYSLVLNNIDTHLAHWKKNISFKTPFSITFTKEVWILDITFTFLNRINGLYFNAYRLTFCKAGIEVLYVLGFRIYRVNTLQTEVWEDKV